MKLTFRTITGKSFHIDAEDGTKIGELKAMVEGSQGADFPKDGMKLVYKGKVLDKEEATVVESGVTDAGFVVVFIQKRVEPPKAAEPAPAAAAPAATPVAAPPASTAATPEAAAPAAPAAPAAATTSAPAAPAAVPVAGAGSGLLSGSGLEEAISNIVEMGFPREEVQKAMRAAFNNPERAVEYLMTGIPASAQAPPQAAPRPAAPRPAAAAAAGGAQPAAPAAGAVPFDMFGGGGAAAAGAPAGPLDFLRTNPQFLMLRRAVQSNPQILVPMLQELGKSNPELLTQINAHHQEFLRLLTEAPEAEGEGGMEEAMAELMGQMGGGGGGQQVIELTEDEAAAITRLENLGFERNACIEAYLSCDKNEELAANFLAEQMFD